MTFNEKYNLVSKIQDALQDRNLSEISRRTGVSMNTLFALKEGRANPIVMTIRTMCQYLNIEVMK